MSQDLLHIADLTWRDLIYSIGLAPRLELRSRRACGEPAEVLVVIYFTEPSARTWIVVPAAATQFGAPVVAFGSAVLRLGSGVNVTGIARAVSPFAYLFNRTEDDNAHQLAAAMTSMVNGLTDAHRPCQRFADLVASRDELDSLGEAGR